MASAPAHDLGKERFSCAGIANEHQIRTSRQEREVEQPQDAVFVLLAGLMVLKVEGVDTGLGLPARVLKAAFDGAFLARFQFQIGEPFQCRGGGQVSIGRLRKSRLQLAAHGRQIQLR